MSRRRQALPERLHERIFSVADAPELSRARLRGADLAAPFYGVRLPSGRPPTLLERCRARATRLPSSVFFSHLTAARLHGLPIPHGADDRLHISARAGSQAPRGKGVTGHVLTVADGDVIVSAGVSLTSAARTFHDLATVLPLSALVAVGDELLRRGITKDQLLSSVRAGGRGCRLVCRAAELLDEASESPKESELRVVLIEAGFPRLACNHVVRDEYGRFVARVDLAHPERRIAVEYEGDHHRDKRQWRQDLKRRRRLEALGWRYFSVTQADLDDPADLFDDLRTAFAG